MTIVEGEGKIRWCLMMKVYRLRKFPISYGKVIGYTPDRKMTILIRAYQTDPERIGYSMYEAMTNVIVHQ